MALSVTSSVFSPVKPWDLVSNYGFESDLTGWAVTTKGSPTYSVSTTTYRSGAKSINIQGSGQDVVTLKQSNINVTGGEKYWLALYYRGSVGNLCAYIEWYDSGGSKIGESELINKEIINVTAWKKKEILLYAHSSATKANIIILVSGSSNLFLDDIFFAKKEAILQLLVDNDTQKYILGLFNENDECISYETVYDYFDNFNYAVDTYASPEADYYVQELAYQETLYMTVAQNISRTPNTLTIITLDYCLRAFGVSPCLATGTPCYNTWPTCRYTSAYQQGFKDYKFCSRDAPTPLPGENVRPYLDEADYLGQEIRPQEALTLNQQLTLTMADEEDNDIGIDPYRVSLTLRDAGGGNNQSIAPAGTFWRKLITRNKNYKNRVVSVKQGFVQSGFAEGDYNLYFKGILDNISFDNRGRAKLIIKGLLQLTAVDYPKKTDGQLSADIDSSATSFTLKAWTGLDTSSSPVVSQYDASGYIRINSEIFYYSRSVDTATGITTFSGLQRGQFNGDGWSQATSHKAGDIAQQVKTYVDQNPIDIMKDLLNQAGISDTDIDVGQFNSERDKWFVGVKFRGVLHEPVKVKTYLQELREQTFTSIWQGDDQKIKVKFTGPNLPGQTYRPITDAANIIRSSHAVDDKKHEYLSRATVYYDIEANKPGSEPAQFKRATVVINSDVESANENGAVSSRKPIYSRWIRTDLAGDSYTRSVANRILRQTYQGVQTIQFELELKDEDLALGEIFELTSKDVVDIDGQPKIEKWQVIKKQKSSRGRIQYVAVNTRLKKRYVFVAPNGTSDYITYSAGIGTVGTTGSNATFSVAHGLSIGHYVRLTSGAQSGETRRVSAILSATTAALESPFSAGQTGQTWNKGVLATASQREYGFVSNNSGKMSNGDDGYLVI